MTLQEYLEKVEGKINYFSITRMVTPMNKDAKVLLKMLKQFYEGIGEIETGGTDKVIDKIEALIPKEMRDE